MKKQKRKKRLKVGRLFLLLLFLAAISFLCVKFINVPIMNIRIEGNNILSDQEIIELAKLQDYPSFLSTFTFNVKNKIKKNSYIEDVKVSKGMLSIKIKVTEKKVLYIDGMTSEKVMEDKRIKDEKILCVPYLINEVPDDKHDEFIKGMSKIDSSVLCKMSEIKYDPNDIDDDRYFVYMNDGNNVYLTVNKFSKINKYNTILESIGKQNGVLYLDYGDYFKVK